MRVTGDVEFWLRAQTKPDRVAADAVPAVMVETGALCNLRCPFCSTGNGMGTLSREFMRKEDFRIILDRLGPGVKTIYFFNLGEPLLNPDLCEMIALASARGIDGAFSTSLSVPSFTAQTASALVASGLKGLAVSCDGASQATYELYRRGGDFSLVMKNLRLLLQAKRRAGAEYPQLTWKFLVHKGNHHEQEVARSMARDLGVEIEFKPLGMIPRHLLSEWSLPAEAPAREAAKEPPAKEEPKGPLPPAVIDSFYSSACLSVWDRPFIHSDGTILPCCAAGKDDALGNLLERPLEELWNVPKVAAMRRYLKSGAEPETPIPCRGCALNPRDR